MAGSVALVNSHCPARRLVLGSSGRAGHGPATRHRIRGRKKLYDRARPPAQGELVRVASCAALAEQLLELGKGRHNPNGYRRLLRTCSTHPARGRESERPRQWSLERRRPRGRPERHPRVSGRRGGTHSLPSLACMRSRCPLVRFTTTGTIRNAHTMTSLPMVVQLKFFISRDVVDSVR
jgi:hypothetical protein